MSRLVIGLGSSGDDGIGAVVARAVQELRCPDVRVDVQDDPLDLVPLWGRADVVVVVHAVRTGATPGTLVVHEAGADAGQLTDGAWVRAGEDRACGVAAAVELARALHRLPPRLVAVGVEVDPAHTGDGLSRRVSAAVPTAVRVVTEAVALVPEPSSRRRSWTTMVGAAAR